jgi:hypothetical protein
MKTFSLRIYDYYTCPEIWTIRHSRCHICVAAYPQTQPNFEHYLNALKLLGRSLMLQHAYQTWGYKPHYRFLSNYSCPLQANTTQPLTVTPYTHIPRVDRRNTWISLCLSCTVTTKKNDSRSENKFTWRVIS